MRVTEVTIENLRSFGSRTEIRFSSPHVVLVGSNNAGKSTILLALDLLLGSKAPGYLRLDPDDFRDVTKPVLISAILGEISKTDKGPLYSLCTNKQQRGALAAKDDPTIELKLTIPPPPGRSPEASDGDGNDEAEPESPARPQLEILLWGWAVRRRLNDVRSQLVQMVTVSPHRRVEADLSASRWTPYGQLMKTILESSEQFGELERLLNETNDRVKDAFAKQKAAILDGARVVSYVDDIDFRLTEQGNPVELLRNLEVFVAEEGRQVNLDHLGTGTQSAVIIGLLELVLRAKSGRVKVFAIEEPEAFIHPHGVRHLGRLLRRIASEPSGQVVIASHSPALLATLTPTDIIRVEKVSGESRVFQPTIGTIEPQFARYVNQDTAEMFFSKRVVLVEGETERFLLPPLANLITKDGEPLDFDRQHISVTSLGSRDTVMHYLRILHAFGIDAWAILDNDFLQSGTLKTLVEYLRGRGVTIDDSTNETLRRDLLKAQIIVLSQGEIENYVPDADIVAMTSKTLVDVQAECARHPKRSSAFKELFRTGKPQYARQIAEHYRTAKSIPKDLERLIATVAT